MKGLEKLTSVRLAEILSQKGSVPPEVITDALYAQDRLGEPFLQVLVGGGHISEWDLAKTVVEQFQLPFLLPGNHAIDEEAKTRLPKEVLFKHLLVPIDVFDDVVSVVMPVLTPHDVMLRLQKEHSCELFPYVGLISENRKVLTALYKDFAEWAEDDNRKRERARGTVREPTGSGAAKEAESTWMSIFDAGDQAIQQSLSARTRQEG